jgi:hypothetical protein
MSRVNTNQIIACVDLLRSIDRLLMEAEAVRTKRAALDKLLINSVDTSPPTDSKRTEGSDDVV